MTSTEYTSNHKFSSQSVFKEQINYFPQKQDSKPPSRYPSSFIPQPLNNYIFNSNFSKRKYSLNERLNSFDPFKNEKNNEIFGYPFIQPQFKNKCPSFFEFPIEEKSRDQSRFQSKISKFDSGFEKAFKLGQKNFLLSFNDEESGQENDEGKKEIFFDKKNKINNNFHYEIDENSKTEKNMNLNIKKTTNINNNMGTKFFTNHNYGYKCSCTKTQCNRKYCECFNSGNYCIDCNCKNCLNQPPINTYSNKRPNDIVSKMKKSKEICTCTKSGCNKNYCECFKNGNKCSSLCRCIGCENTEVNSRLIIKRKRNYECCLVNSIYIIKNEIFIEKIGKKGKEDGHNNKIISESITYNMINKKRKREEIKNNEDINDKKIKRNKEEEIFLFNDSLFDNKGKVILSHINMLHYE